MNGTRAGSVKLAMRLDYQAKEKTSSFSLSETPVLRPKTLICECISPNW